MACVLLIDDDPELLRQMGAIFLAAGHRVLTALDGRIGLGKFREGSVDLVVTDIIMPVCEGIETIVAIRKLDPKVKIVAISGGFRVGPEDFLALARRLGADLTLAKPFRLDALRQAAEGLLRGRAEAEVV